MHFANKDNRQIDKTENQANIYRDKQTDCQNNIVKEPGHLEKRKGLSGRANKKEDVLRLPLFFPHEMFCRAIFLSYRPKKMSSVTESVIEI